MANISAKKGGVYIVYKCSAIVFTCHFFILLYFYFCYKNFRATWLITSLSTRRLRDKGLDEYTFLFELLLYTDIVIVFWFSSTFLFFIFIYIYIFFVRYVVQRYSRKNINTELTECSVKGFYCNVSGMEDVQ